MINAQAYVQDGRLIVLGVAELRNGVVPISYSCAIEGEEKIEDGPVDFGADDLAEPLKKAVDELQPAVQEQVKRGAIAIHAEALVLRARQGDQNAMAMLSGIAENAKNGSKKAGRALKEVKRYIREHPADEDNFFGELTESEKSVAEHLKKHLSSDDRKEYVLALTTMAPYVSPEVIAFMLADGPLINEELLKAITDELSDGAAKEFKRGYNNKGNSLPAQFGRTVKEASLIQRVRDGEPASILSSEIGWELGN